MPQIFWFLFLFFFPAVKPQQFDKCHIQLIIARVIFSLTMTKTSQDPLQ